jgi:hypothetical protein
MTKQQIIEKYQIAIRKYQLFTNWVLKHTPEIEQSQRGKDHIAEINKAELAIRAMESELTSQPDKVTAEEWLKTELPETYEELQSTDNFTYYHAIEAIEKFASLPRDVAVGDEKIYDIDCAGHVMIQLSIKSGVPTVLQAMNGYGESVKISDILIKSNK